jgi:predicted house-cleaning noncanonical NTP pyrophosphatase (MazG superfamily)
LDIKALKARYEETEEILRMLKMEHDPDIQEMIQEVAEQVMFSRCVWLIACAEQLLPV